VNVVNALSDVQARDVDVGVGVDVNVDAGLSVLPDLSHYVETII
jgi:hypothetical protein